MKKQFQHGMHGKRTNLVPVLLIGGITAMVKTDAIPDADWTHHHGKTPAGKQVNSLKSMEIGESVLIKGNTGPTLSATQAEAEIFAMQYLTGKGYKIQPPSIGQQ